MDDPTTLQPYEIQHRALDAFTAHPGNPKDHDISEIRESMRRFGFTEPVIVDERTGYTISGHGRIEALEAMQVDGQEAPAGVLSDADGWHVPTVVGWESVDDMEAKAYLVAANRLVERGGWRSDPLAAILSDLATLDAGMVGTGYREGDLDALLIELREREPDVPDEFPKFDEGLATDHECPSCGYAW